MLRKRAPHQVEWNLPPRPLSEFVSLNKFTPPKSQKKLESRLKCNIYVFRTNYALLIGLITCSPFLYLRQPGALLSLVVCTFAILLVNDTFAVSLR